MEHSETTIVEFLVAAFRNELRRAPLMSWVCRSASGYSDDTELMLEQMFHDGDFAGRPESR
jgi:hypothetical protein